MKGIGAIPKIKPKKNIKTAFGIAINNGIFDENAMLAQRNPIEIPTRIVRNIDKPNVPDVVRSTRKSAAEAISPMTSGPSFLDTTATIISNRIT